MTHILRPKSFNLLWGAVLAVLAALIYFLHITRKLPWQHPVFDTKLPQVFPPVKSNSILIFSKTNGFRHKSILAGQKAIEKAGLSKGWSTYITENGALINPAYLRQFNVVVFLSTSGEILTDAQKAAFENYIENGGGYAGIHSASDTEHGWQWYERLLGTSFRDHTWFPSHLPEAELITENTTHPANRGLPARWKKVDEWYNFKSSVRGKAGFRVLLSLNEKSYRSFWPKMNGNHPISWTQQAGNGRMFYTALGHNSETFSDKYAMRHIIGGIAWAGRLE